MNSQEEQLLLEILESVAQGVYSERIHDLTRPEYPEEVRRIAEAMGMMMVRVEAREMRLEGLVAELKGLNQQLKDNAVQVVSSMAAALEARDQYTKGHAERVSRYATRLAQRLDLPPDEIERVCLAGMLHDVGKIGFSDSVFNNEDTRPTDEMLKEIRQHPIQSHDIISRLEFLDGVAEYVYDHHERPDGKGYPRGLSLEDIPQGARIISVADVFDAITTTRSYQEKFPLEKAFGILRNLAGKGLDAELVEPFIEEIEQGGLEDVSSADA